MILGAIFIASGIAKIPSVVNFELYIFSLDLFSFDVCSIIARLLISSEIIIGIWLIIHIYNRLANYVTAGILGVFSLFLIWRILLHDETSCHCLGDLVDMKPGLSLLKNIILAGLLALAWKSTYNIPHKNLNRLYALYATIILFLLPFCIVPPDIYFRFSMAEENTVAERNLLEEVSDSLLLGKSMVCLYSTECQYCKHCSKKVSEIVQRHDIPISRIEILFMDIPLLSTDIIDSFFLTYGNSVHLPYKIVEAERFISLSEGEMPIIVLLEDGQIRQEYNYLTLNENDISNHFLHQH